MSDAQKQFFGYDQSKRIPHGSFGECVARFVSTGAGRINLDRQIVSLRSVIEEAVQRSIERMRSKSINFDWSPPPELPLVRADPVRMVQIVDDLLSNASLYTPDEERFRFTCDIPLPISWYRQRKADAMSRSRSAIVESGLPRRNQSKLFKQFFRGDHPLVQEAGGTGFSLLVTRRLVDLHGGRIGVSSQLGQGSRFQFCGPALSADAPSGPVLIARADHPIRTNGKERSSVSTEERLCCALSQALSDSVAVV